MTIAVEWHVKPETKQLKLNLPVGFGKPNIFKHIPNNLEKMDPSNIENLQSLLMRLGGKCNNYQAPMNAKSSGPELKLRIISSRNGHLILYNLIMVI